MMQEEDIEFLINHVFLPYKLPAFMDEIDYEKEPLFLKIISKAVDIVSNLGSLNESYNEIKRMMKEWEIIQKNVNFEGNRLSEKIKNLKTNQVLPLYLKEQNACIIFKYTPDSRFIFSAFQVSASNNQVMSANTDLIGLFPKFSIFVHNEYILRSTVFANQLADLTRNKISFAISNKSGQTQYEMRDVPEPKLVFDWLPAVLVGVNSSIIVENDQKVLKKIRDDIVFQKNKLYPFRRSGMWMSIKVVLQLRLCELFGEFEGKIIYKIVIAIVISNLCQDAVVDSDLKLQMIKKLARRIYKLNLLPKFKSKNNSLVAKVIDSCAKTIQNTKKSLNMAFENLVINSRRIKAQLILNNIDLQDKFHELSDLLKFIKNLKKNNDTEITRRVPTPNQTRNKCTPFSFPDVQHLNYSKFSLTALFDIECWVQEIDFDALKELKHISSLKLKDLMVKYINKAQVLYNKDELGYSKMILTVIKIVCLLDKLAINEFPMLKYHKIGLDTLPIESLLLLRSTELMYCHDLVEYIESRNHKNTPYKSLVDLNKIDENTFSVRYASQDEEMQFVKKKIIKEAEEKKNLKIKELHEKRQIYYELMEEQETLNCEYYDSMLNLMMEHNPNCLKCKITKEAKAMNVKIYEWPLPEDKNLQNAVIFELRIPQSISDLRDAVHIFRTKILGIKNKSLTELRGTWIAYNEISKYALKRERVVTLGSFKKLFAATHYSDKHPSTYPGIKS